MTVHAQLPISLDSARERLEIRVFGRAPEEARRAGLRSDVAQDEPAFASGGGALLTGAVVQMGDERWPVTRHLAEMWGATPDAVVLAAFETSRDRVDRDGFRLESIQAGTYRVVGGYRPSLLTRARALASQVTVTGETVLLAPTSGIALVTGAEDIAGLAMVAALAREQLMQHPLDVVSATPLVWRDELEPFAWPTVSEARWRDRRATARLSEIVAALDASFDAACAAVQAHAAAEGLPIRRFLDARSADDTVSAGWMRLAKAFGLTDDDARRVRDAAADPLAQLDPDEETSGSRAQQMLEGMLSRSGSLLAVSRKTDPALLAQDASTTPAARAIGAVIELGHDYDGALDLCEAVAERSRAVGVDVTGFGEIGSDVQLVFFPAEQRAEVSAAAAQIGDGMLLTSV